MKLLFSMLLSLFISTSAMAMDKALVAKVVSIAKSAVSMLQVEGQSGLIKLDEAKYKDQKNDVYVFVFNYSGVVIHHAKKPLIGKNLMALKDQTGFNFTSEFINVAKSAKGKGWVTYWWPRPETKQQELKSSYIEKVPGKDMFIGIGIYGLTKEEATELNAKL